MIFDSLYKFNLDFVSINS